MDQLLLIDTHALVHRFFHALPPLTSTTGEPINAIYGICKTILAIGNNGERPKYIAAALDRPEQTFRKAQFEQYKIHRPPAPTELVAQFKQLPDLFKAFGVSFFSVASFEADDVIGTITEKFSSVPDLQIAILSGDLDVLQLVRGEKIVGKILKNGTTNTELYNESRVLERFGLTPHELPNYKGLVGDTSDNIPGVKGIGEKTAVTLLQEFKTIEEVFENTMIITPSVAKKLEGQRDVALLSRELATIRKDVPLPVQRIEELEWKAWDKDRLFQYFTTLGFQSLVP